MAVRYQTFRDLLDEYRGDLRARIPLEGRGKLFLDRHPGAMHFEIKKTGEPSRWNTLRALCVMRRLGIENVQ